MPSELNKNNAMAAGAARDRLIVILGPTAVGKTALSIELARALDTEIVSGDSMLVYRGFDIGSAKPTLAERQGIEHYLIDTHDGRESFNVADFVRAAQPIIRSLNARGKIPIIAGGTGLYIKALLEGYEFNEQGRDSEYRAYLEQVLAEKGKDYLYAELARVSPAAAARTHANNIPRVIRALEVAHSGEQLSAARASEMLYDAYVIGLNRDRAALYERINRRVELMLAGGLVAEVRALLAAGIGADAPAMKGIGYKEIVQLLAGNIDEPTALDLVQKNTRHFAKRQLTWFRRMPYIHWYQVDTMTDSELLAAVERDINMQFFPQQKQDFSPR